MVSSERVGGPNHASSVVEPETAVALAAALRGAAEERQSVIIRGAGTKMQWGRAPQRVDLVVGTRRLNRVLAHQHGDLTATVEAGATLREVNEALARHGQWLPLDPPYADRATIGGILATNDSGPLRHRFGTPRDLVIGVQLATTDGALAKAGGQVVKNVAGYDLSKLVCGSFGSLAAIVSATFKLAPLPAASKTLVLDVPDIETLAQIVRDVMTSQLEPIAFDLHVHPVAAGHRVSGAAASTIFLRFASLPAVVDAQIGQTSAICRSAGLSGPRPADLKGPPYDRQRGLIVTEGDAERALWDEHARRGWDGSGAIVRASWLPANLAAALKGCPTGVTEIAGRAAVGAGWIRIEGDVRAQASVINELRESKALRHVVIARGSDELKAIVDPWGPLGDRERLFAPLKRAFDPHGILNAGRGPL